MTSAQAGELAIIMMHTYIIIIYDISNNYNFYVLNACCLTDCASILAVLSLIFTTTLENSNNLPHFDVKEIETQTMK